LPIVWNVLDAQAVSGVGFTPAIHITNFKRNVCQLVT
jgi:hypothetical protein